MTEPVVPQFDPIIHPPHRLRICAVLEPYDDYEFAHLRDVLGVSDSVLSKQLSLLESARYVLLRRGLRDGRQRVWVTLTELGREAFRGHVAALREIVGAAGDLPVGNPESSKARSSVAATAAVESTAGHATADATVVGGR